MMESNLELLYVRNNMGTSPSSLLERLWLLVSSDQRTKGDAVGMGGDDVRDGGSEVGGEEVALRHRKPSLFNLSPLCLPALHSLLAPLLSSTHARTCARLHLSFLSLSAKPFSRFARLYASLALHALAFLQPILMQCSLKDDLFGKVAPPKRRYNDAISEDAWRERLLDEVSADFPRHEEYFQGFSDTGTSSGDFFEDIGKEYEQKKRRCVYISRSESSQPSASTTYKKASTSDEEFRHRHAEELRKLGLVSPTSKSDVSVIPYEQYSERWQTFLRSGTNGTIPWPPLKVGDMEELLRFVGRSLLHLRQLQVDWHPDRFFSRLPSGVQRTEDLANRVTALSQFFNKAIAELRSYVENSKH
ncbi:unnamed protein product [Hydatigera taeniaeformis]|uniref:NF-kappa-B inhibitor-like protein 1 n=1 Tax=Hydatigena taeniaeformis TaxID=6205 RepID=A0A3P7HAD8_HYDTA|nr:unnamed protein product [Hydatigera taeniaeformis]